ncbi:iron transporter [Corynebacterium sp. sy017]|uniref:iron uptake transporter permease EfeU n=1 Tax=unclassified Corynebacterium TaxID=2624378 RepID=UPI001185B668|nr:MULTISPECIES: iron uptake transporter permease EfeU [unclassified Corynebacterium]MBP3088720.1 iron transporter [Corynebacterium sp. sy017]TSD92004.1 iron transporter [Corynebacterium sp. SY003]
MFIANFLIALREGVEAALIIGIMVALINKMNRRDILPKMWLGIALAVIIPAAAGAFMTWGPYTLSFQAQEILGGSLSLLAVGMVTWMIFWMGKHSRNLSADITEKTNRILSTGTDWRIVWLSALSVGREGLETAVFTWATVRGTLNDGFLAPSLGVLCGLLCAIAIGWLIYRSTTHINLKKFFNTTAFLLIFVAAGIVSYGIGDFQEANILPGWGHTVYDVTGLFDGHIPGLSTTSWWFVLLEAMFQLNLSPTYLQFFGWFGYLLVVCTLFIMRTRPHRHEQK